MHPSLLRVLKVIFQKHALGAMKNKTSKQPVSLKTIVDKSQAAGDVAGTLQGLKLPMMAHITYEEASRNRERLMQAVSKSG